MTSTVRNLDLNHVALRGSLKLLLNQLGLTYTVNDGLLTITSIESADRPNDDNQPDRGEFSGGMDGMGGATGFTMEQAQASGYATPNQEAASNQAEELRVVDRQGSGSSAVEKDTPSVTFAVTGHLDISSRRDPQGTIGDKTMYLNDEFHLEYTRDLPQAHFLAGGLRERPIGGGAMGMGGMGGGMGGMRSVQLKRE
jgi:hypothetical protein